MSGAATTVRRMKGRGSYPGVHLALFLTMLVWGMNLSAVKVLTERMDILLMASLRMTLAAVVLALIAWRYRLSWPAWTGKTFWLGLLAAFLLVDFQQIAFAHGMSKTSATNAALVMALGPMVSVLLEGLLFRRKVSQRQMAGIGAGLCGVAVVILNRPGASVTDAATGDLWVLASVCGFALGGACLQRLSQHTHPLSISVFVHVVGAAMLWLHVAFGVPNVVDQVVALQAWPWLLVFFSGFMATAIGAIVWARGIAVLGVGRTASYLSWVPVFGVGFGALALGETITPWHVLGILGVLAGSALAARH